MKLVMRLFLHRNPDIGVRRPLRFPETVHRSDPAEAGRRNPSLSGGAAFCRSARPVLALGALAAGALAVGALAIGALAVGRFAIGRLLVGRSHIGTLHIDNLRIGRLDMQERGSGKPDLPEPSGS